MKEKYFTAIGIEDQAKSMLDEIKHLRKCKDLHSKLENSALLILDMQDYFLDEDSHAYVPSGLSILNNIKLLANYFEEMGQPIFITQHLNSINSAGQMGVWWNDLINKDSEFCQIHSGLSDIEGKLIIKEQYDAFHKTDLLPELINRRIQNVVVTGVMTHLCVETTARSAFVNGFGVILPADATATYNRDLHLSSLKTLAHGFANIVLTSEIIN